MEAFLISIPIIIFLAYLSRFYGKNIIKINEYIRDNNFKHYKNVDCLISGSYYFYNQLFDVYVNENHYVFLQSNPTIGLFFEKYMVKNKGTNSLIESYFDNLITLHSINNKEGNLVIVGRLQTRPFFSKSFGEMGKIRIEATLAA
jgi:hypothetical protein